MQCWYMYRAAISMAGGEARAQLCHHRGFSIPVHGGSAHARGLAAEAQYQRLRHTAPAQCEQVAHSLFMNPCGYKCFNRLNASLIHCCYCLLIKEHRLSLLTHLIIMRDHHLNVN